MARHARQRNSNCVLGARMQSPSRMSPRQSAWNIIRRNRGALINECARHSPSLCVCVCLCVCACVLKCQTRPDCHSERLCVNLTLISRFLFFSFVFSFPARQFADTFDLFMHFIGAHQRHKLFSQWICRAVEPFRLFFYSLNLRAIVHVVKIRRYTIYAATTRCAHEI